MRYYGEHMRVILLQDVPKVGRKFSLVTVPDGFANNRLLPRRLAEVATPAAVAALEKRQATRRASEEAHEDNVRTKLGKDASVTITVKADDAGHLYKKVHVHDIVQAIAREHAIDLRDEAVLLDAPIHLVGDHPVQISVADLHFTVTVQVRAA